jgi:hypothetical protein
VLDRIFPVALRQLVPGLGIQLLGRPAAGLVDLLAAEYPATGEQACGKHDEYR